MDYLRFDPRGDIVAKKSQKRGNPAHPTSLPIARARRLFAAMAPPFTRWMAAHPEPIGNVRMVLGLMEEFFISYGLENPGFDGTSFEVPRVAAVLDDVSNDGEEVGGLFAAAIELYIDFLTETDAWTGSDAQLSALAEILAEKPAEEEDLADFAPDAGLPPRPPIDLQPLSPAQALRGVQSLEFVSRATRLLRWVGDARPATDDGRPQRDDVAAVAACFLTEAVGWGTAPWLTTYWSALQDSGFIDISATHVATTPKAAPFLDSSGDLVSAAQELAVALYARALMPVAFAGPADPMSRLRSLHLASAASAKPLSATAVLDSDLPELPAGLACLAGILIGQLRDEIRSWADDGLVTVADKITVPPVLRGSLARAITRADDLMERVQSLQSGESKSTFRLRVELHGMQPPVWRTLDVAASTPLDLLNDDLQFVFGWQFGERHWFHVGSPMSGASFTDVAPDEPYGLYDPDDPYDLYDPYGDADDPILDDAREESHYLLGELIGKVGDSLVYTYGKKWLHKVTLLEVLPPRPKGELPLCTDGSGCSPSEFVDGPAAWPKLAAISQDPNDPLYSRVRRILRLPPGETIDPAAFDVDRANAALRGLP